MEPGRVTVSGTAQAGKGCCACHGSSRRRSRSTIGKHETGGSSKFLLFSYFRSHFWRWRGVGEGGRWLGLRRVRKKRRSQPLTCGRAISAADKTTQASRRETASWTAAISVDPAAGAAGAPLVSSDLLLFFLSWIQSYFRSAGVGSRIWDEWKAPEHAQASILPFPDGAGWLRRLHSAGSALHRRLIKKYFEKLCKFSWQLKWDEMVPDWK